MGNYREVKQLTIAQAAYIAGLIDGEGTVTLTQEHSNENRRLVVSISSTERELLDFVKNSLGAGHVTNKRTYSDNHTPSFTYKVTSRQALDVLRQIRPYMQGYKEKRAAFALESYLSVTPRNGHYNAEQKQTKKEFEDHFLSILPHGS